MRRELRKLPRKVSDLKPPLKLKLLQSLERITSKLNLRKVSANCIESCRLG